jgi:hypothetical protein
MAIVDRKGNRLKVEVSYDGKALNDATKVWANISADAGTLSNMTGDRDIAGFNTHAGSELGYSDPSMMEFTLTVVHRNSASSTLEDFKETFNGVADSAVLDIRWAYNEGAVGALRTACKCILRTNPHTGADPGSSAPITIALTFATTPSDIHEDVVPTPP